MKQPNPHLFCFGLGYSACELALGLKQRGWRVSGTHRPSVSLQNTSGIKTFAFDRNMPLINVESLFKDVTHVLISIPPDAAGCPVVDIHGDDLVRHIPHIKWLGYLSTVGVYGNTDGKPVNETSRLLPTQDRSRFRGLAETRWQNFAVRSGLPLSVFRLAGIYGPDRNPFEKIRANKAQRIHKPGHLFSRIHVTDIANVLTASMAHLDKTGVYNVCDDDPAEPADVIKYACDLLGYPAPDKISFADACQTMSSMAQSFWADNKLILNDKIKDALGVKLIYPDYKVGLTSILECEKQA